MIQTQELTFPSRSEVQYSDEAEDLMKKLLVKSPFARLGRRHGVDEILSHPWFADLDFERLLRKQMPVPEITAPPIIKI